MGGKISSYKKGLRKRTRVILFVVIVFVIVMSIAYRRLWEKSAALQKEEAQLEQQIEKAKDKKQELKDKKEYIKTKEFIEKTAREKFGLFYPDEYVVRPSK